MHDHLPARWPITSETTAADMRRWARAWLSDVVAGRGEVTAVRHPLGFLCFPVWRGGTLGICVHVWCDGVHARLTTSPIHAHSWDLVSFVLYGTVANEVVDVVDAAAPTHRIFEVRSDEDGDLVRATPRLVRHRHRSRELFGRGDTYRLPRGVFHLSDVRGNAATVVLGDYRPDCPDRSLGAVLGEDHRVYRIRCTAEETRRFARVVLERLADSNTPRELEDRCDQARS
ncbi:hypothetical protein [Nocardia bovistercoris]|uniref:Uncharacterized protein n=1 Tax=Nocardia bovistercoris TaxID=2785916 RepID=A0A931IG77_9NOCA|nr:hypothetical protein [Nocardia bovistercoris]MBH0779462.1 hypothetical protein [Nocardia bovistercoris]